MAKRRQTWFYYYDTLWQEAGGKGVSEWYCYLLERDERASDSEIQYPLVSCKVAASFSCTYSHTFLERGVDLLRIAIRGAHGKLQAVSCKLCMEHPFV